MTANGNDPENKFSLITSFAHPWNRLKIVLFFSGFWRDHLFSLKTAGSTVSTGLEEFCVCRPFLLRSHCSILRIILRLCIGSKDFQALIGPSCELTWPLQSNPPRKCTPIKAGRNAQSEESECNEWSWVFIPSRAGNTMLYRVGQRFSE